MKRFLLIAIVCTIFSGMAKTQGTSDTLLYQKAWKANRTGMLTLSTWGAVNMGSGFILSQQTQGEASYFHQMNGLWNTVNFGLGVFGLIKSQQMLKKPQMDAFSSGLKKIEKSYRINFYIDFAYIGTGVGLRVFNDRFNDPELARGYGSSIITQGIFLLGFDWIMSRCIQRKINKKTTTL